MKEERKKGELQKNAMERKGTVLSENFRQSRQNSSDSQSTVAQIGLPKIMDLLKNQKKKG